MSRPAARLFPVVAHHVEAVTPRMRRITVEASCLAPFRVGLPAQFLKVFVPQGSGQPKAGRAYTIRRFDPVSHALSIDFALHGDDGPASAWAARVRAGDAFEISPAHPRSGYPIDPATMRYRLFGDATALPAIGSILEALPTHAQADVFLEVAGPGEEQDFATGATVRVNWLYDRIGGGPADPSPLEQVARALGRPDEGTPLWVAGESSVVRSLRDLALRDWGVGRDRLQAVAYWKRGDPAYKARGD